MLTRSLVLAAGFGWLAGMRTAAAPTFAARRLARAPGWLQGRAARALASRGARTALPLLAAAELVVDKLPAAPDRTVPALLLARAVSSTLCGAAVAEGERMLGGRAALAAAVACAAAVTSAYVNLGLRRRASRVTGFSTRWLGLVEDAMAVGLGLGLEAA